MPPRSEPERPAPQAEQPRRSGGRRRRRRRKRSSGQPAEQPQRTATDAQRQPAATAGAKQTRVSQRTQRRGAATGRQRKKPTKRKKTSQTSQKRSKIPTTREVSAGGVLYRRVDHGIEVVLASRRTRRGQLAWGLAKGGIERGESKEQAALREVREETGLTAKIEADLGDTKYIYVWDDIRIRKTVHFFLMRHTGGDADDRDDEMEEIRWFPLERAIKRAAYRGERDMLVKASEMLT
jgi:8-oxo-dGTP pyrophosphatase MutT (NUDIX family)